MACTVVLSEDTDADPSEITVSGTVTNEDFTKTNMKKVALAFVSDDHIVLATVASNQNGIGTYSVVLKPDHDYNVRSFNMKNDASAVIKSGSNMDYIIYKDIRTGDSDYTLNLDFEKATSYTDPSNNEYYLYESGLAALVKVGVEFDELEGDVPYCVKEGQTIVIPETINVENKEYRVTFIGKSITEVGSIIQSPDPRLQNPLVFRGETSNLLTLRFEGDVILNYQPFTAPFGAANKGTQSSEKYNFRVIFDKDVSVNSYPKTTNSRLMASGFTLTAMEEVSIGGIYHGALTYLNGEVMRDFGAWPLANVNIKTITFDKDFDGLTVDVEYGVYPMENATIDSLGMIDGSKLTVSLNQETGKYVLKNHDDETVCDAISNVTNNPITLRVINGDSVTYSLVTKGLTKVLEEPVAPEGKEFGGWYNDSGYTQVYNPSEPLNANTTVYAKLVPKQYTISILGDGITVKNGDSVVADGSKIAFETSLTLALEERVGYRAIVKMDGAVVSDTVNVPAKDFTITSEWVAIPYTVKCMDGETVVKTFENCRLGDVISLPAVKKDGFTGWSVENGMLLGAQYVVSYGDVGANDTIVLNASLSEIEDTVWSLTVTGTDIEGKAFWTKSNAIGSYGIVTVIPGEFEKATVAIEPAVVGAYVGKLSDSTYMVYSANGEDVTVTVSFQSVGKASEYVVSLVEIAKEGAPGFRAIVTATDGGVVDASGTLSVRYVYKVKDATSGLWCYTTSGPTGTEGVPDCTFDLSNLGNAYAVSKDFFLSDVENADGAYLVYGYASYSFKDTSAGSEATVTVASPVIMSVSEIQAVVSKT